MSTKPSPIKRAVNAAMNAIGPKQYGVHGKPFVCQLCGHDRFTSGPRIMILAMRTLACADCGHVEFFAKLPPLI
jgi:hypothetical protein